MKKTIAIFLVSIFTFSFFSSVTTSASTLNTTAITNKYTLKYIENMFLEQNTDGTFYFTDGIKTILNKDLLKILENNLSNINNHILNNDLQFKIVKKNNQKEVINTVDNLSEKLKRQALKLRSTGHIFNYTYGSNFKFSWYGFTVDLNKKGSEQLRNYLTIGASATGTSTGIAALNPIGYPIAAAMGLVTLTIGVGIYQCEIGITSGNGTTVKALGAPSDATIYSIKGH